MRRALGNAQADALRDPDQLERIAAKCWPHHNGKLVRIVAKQQLLVCELLATLFDKSSENVGWRAVVHADAVFGVQRKLDNGAHHVVRTAADGHGAVLITFEARQ